VIDLDENGDGYYGISPKPSDDRRSEVVRGIATVKSA
jgi:hypothetical protein